MYNTLEQACRRLEESLVRHNGEPFYITRISYADERLSRTNASTSEVGAANIRASGYVLDGQGGRETRSYTLDDDRWDFMPVPLGWVQHSPGRATYVSRMPSARGRQGLCSREVFHQFPEGLAEGGAPRTLLTPGLVKCVKREYPSFPEVLQILQEVSSGSTLEDYGGVYCEAFHHRYALYLDSLGVTYLLNKTGQPVGALSFGGLFRLKPECVYLSQELNSLGVPTYV